MKRKSTWLAALAGCVLFASLAEAQATRTWVSGVGDDVNPCSRTAPCKTFAGAISKTASPGEISVLDPGGFGTVTITKSITLDGDGTLASILSSGVQGIVVNAGANDVIRIRNISINGSGTTLGTNGITFLAGKELIVENCWIQNLSGHGLNVNLGSSGKLTVINTTIHNVGGVAIRATTSAGSLAVSIDNVQISGAAIGFDLLSGVGTISRSTIAHSSGQALVAEGSAVINAEGCVLSSNGTGVQAFTAGSTVRISNCDLMNNTSQIAIAAGGTVATFQNNKIVPASAVAPNQALSPSQ